MTPRKLAILGLKCRRDLSNSEVGYALGITTQTVKNQMSAIYRAIDVLSIAGACYWLGKRDAEIPPAFRKEEV